VSGEDHHNAGGPLTLSGRDSLQWPEKWAVKLLPSNNKVGQTARQYHELKN
jgi:hypothetical protein